MNCLIREVKVVNTEFLTQNIKGTYEELLLLYSSVGAYRLTPVDSARKRGNLVED